jgi:hypothetical protein
VKRAMRMAEFARMPRPQQDRVLREMVAATKEPPNGECAEVDAEIHAFEQRFGIDSAAMRAQVRSGEMKESWDICKWLMTLDRRDRLAKRAARSG